MTAWGGLCYNDELIRVDWEIKSTKIILTLANLTDKTIEINWDKSCYVDPDGFADHTTHGSVKFIDAERNQVPSYIPKGAKINDIMIPTGNVHFREENIMKSKVGGWDINGILPYVFKNHREGESVCSNYIGKTIRILLHLTIGTQETEYIFTFSIDKVSVKRPYYIGLE